MKNKHTDNRREQALDILKGLLKSLKGLTADIYYTAIREAGFSEGEAVKYTGAVMRTASARGYMEKTPFSQSSQRNSSNLQSVWLSRMFEDTEQAALVRQHWSSKGFKLPHHEADIWEKRNQYFPQDEKPPTVSEKAHQ